MCWSFGCWGGTRFTERRSACAKKVEATDYRRLEDPWQRPPVADSRTCHQLGRIGTQPRFTAKVSGGSKARQTADDAAMTRS